MNIIKSKILPIKRSDIDTDLIFPANFLYTTEKVGLGQHLFDRLRKIEPDFPMNLATYDGAKILVARHNFGCGSSREHAAWAIKDYGIDVVVAPSFADIFYNNALKNGILLVVLSEDIVENIFQEEQKSDGYILEVNLGQQTVTFPDGSKNGFAIDPYRKECLMKGMEDMDYLLANMKEIETFDKKHQQEIFFDVSKL